jgi:hypothetical protein
VPKYCWENSLDGLEVDWVSHPEEETEPPNQQPVLPDLDLALQIVENEKKKAS